MRIKTLVAIILISLVAACSYKEDVQKPNVEKIIYNLPSFNEKAIKLGVNGYLWAKQNGHVKKKRLLTIIDFTLPSIKKRMAVIDLKTSKVLMLLLTSHGQHSGNNLATHFSNYNKSHETSLGIFLTAEIYTGKHGKSLRLDGLEKGINDNARSRYIVVHGAEYVSEEFIKNHGRLGRSWGCFAVNPKKLNKLIKTIKNGSIIFAYAAPEDKDPIVNNFKPNQ